MSTEFIPIDGRETMVSCIYTRNLLQRYGLMASPCKLCFVDDVDVAHVDLHVVAHVAYIASYDTINICLRLTF